jgi:hypothetical protein
VSGRLISLQNEHPIYVSYITCNTVLSFGSLDIDAPGGCYSSLTSFSIHFSEIAIWITGCMQI